MFLLEMGVRGLLNRDNGSYNQPSAQALVSRGFASVMRAPALAIPLRPSPGTTATTFAPFRNSLDTKTSRPR